MDIMMPDCFGMTLEIDLTHSFNKSYLRAHPVSGAGVTSCARKAKQWMKSKDAYDTLKVKHHTLISGA